MPKKVKTTVEFEGRVSEILVDIPDIETPLWGNDAELDIVGHPIPRVDGDKRVTGAAKYTSDILLPHMLYGRILRSAHPHAVVKSVNSSEAEKLPGVKAVISAFNTDPIRWHGSSSLFDKTARLVGDEVAAVAAVDEETAADALELIKVDYETLPFVTDMEEAMKDTAPKLWPNGNVVGGKPSIYERGSVSKGFAEADLVIEETFRTQTELHTCLETHGSVAFWEGDKLTVWDSTQAVFNVRDALAAALNIPSNHVRVIKQYMGGGFGSKLELGKYTVIAALLARRTNRPVRLMLTREEDQMNTGNRPATLQHVKVGVKKDGTLTAIELKSVNANGAYLGGAGCGAPYREMYLCANVRTEEYAVYVNTGRSRPARAPGHVQGTFGLESMMDVVSRKIGMDPLEFRKKNYATVNQAQTNPKPYSAKLLDQLYEAGAKKIDWWNRDKSRNSGDFHSRKRGVGMASQIWGGGGGPPAYALVKINRDGSVNVLSGTQDLGTGTKTIISQIAAEELGIALADVAVDLGDTETCPFSGSSGGSTTAASVGPAVRTAAADARLQLFEYAALELKVKPEELSSRRGKIFVKSDPQKSLPFKEAARKAGNNMIIGKGFRGPNPDGYSLNTFGAHFAEVEVDMETGRVTVLRHVAAHHSGRPFNPLTMTSQIEGGVIQSMGYALSEQRVIDPASGIPLNMNMENYKPMTALDVPTIEPILLTQVDEHCNTLGGKGIGEPPRIPAAAAIANAVADAIGIRIRELPITPDKVLAALKSSVPSHKV
ncbi:MAG: xanthine dehydrogenase family protein molybdopterin-binding subunit [Acidobacteriia bacterium]|nr:xanthine dehydrogenase family protein molybdopterin-binding subunit [Terriglobia bacterium]